jgi:hypothetical protein
LSRIQNWWEQLRRRNTGAARIETMNQWRQKLNQAAHTCANQKRTNIRLKAEQEKENRDGSKVWWW